MPTHPNPIILFAAIVLCLLNPSNSEMLPLDSKNIKADESIIECIGDKIASLSFNPIMLCGAETKANIDCYSSYYSINLCLVNNECTSAYDVSSKEVIYLKIVR